MPPSQEIDELRNAVRSLQGGLLAALDSLEVLIENSDNRNLFDSKLATLKDTVKLLSDLQPSRDKPSDDDGSSAE